MRQTDGSVLGPAGFKDRMSDILSPRANLAGAATEIELGGYGRGVQSNPDSSQRDEHQR